MKKLPFNLEKALAGEPVVTRDGREVTEIHHFTTATEDEFPVNAVISGVIHGFTPDGIFYMNGTSTLDLFIAQKTITVNCFEVPAPESNELKDGDAYYYPEFSEENLSCPCTWCDNNLDLAVLKNKVLHLSEENAIAHAKAMLGIDPWAEDCCNDE